MERSFYKNYFEIEKKHWLMKVRHMIVRDMLSHYIKRKPKTVKILDFGCGSGYFVSRLASSGYDAYGLDISLEAIQYGKNQDIKNLDVINSHKINFPDNYFDAVLAMDVFEHLEGEEWALKEIERVLKPGGVGIIMVPAYMFLWGVQDEAAHHYRRYTLGRFLKKIRSNSSFSILRASYFNTFLFLPIALVRFLSRLFGFRKRHSDFDINNDLLDKVFFSIFNLEKKILRYINFPFGVSILAVLRKSEGNII